MSFAYKYLDGEQLYRVYWVEMGEARSIKRLASWCAANGLKNKRTGKPPTRMGAWKAMWRWAANNPEQAFEIINTGLKDTGEMLDRQQFMKELQEKVITSYQSDGFTKRWFDKNGVA